jgi:hypothetical protein
MSEGVFPCWVRVRVDETPIRFYTAPENPLVSTKE